jgi:phospho-N-acetylmuramoyl-pentapeptide-transferase
MGLTAKQKLFLQSVISFFIALYYVFIMDMGTEIMIPFAWKRFDIGFWMIPYIMFVVVSMVNSVNLTDGLDGLASGVTAVMSLFFPVMAVLGISLGSGILDGTSSGDEIAAAIIDAVFFAALAGACIGFLIFNRYPARIFMGDTGSLALGGGMAAAAIFSHMELLLPVVGIIFVLEALSDVIQVTSYKLFKKRVFLMAPLHHHFELSNWHEKKVVGVFVSLTLVMCIISSGVMMVQAVL